ncbi:MAG: protein kinase domain-containing protein [Thermoguttaceae bacterium]
MSKQKGEIISSEFMIQRLLLESQFGTVWRGLDLKVGQQVRLYFVPEAFCASENCRKRFDEQLKRVSAFQHPHCVQPNRQIELPSGEICIVSRFVDGPTLYEYVEQWFLAQNSIPKTVLLDVMRPIVSVLEEAKKQGLSHRSLSPHRILVSQANGVQVFDLDIAASIREIWCEENADCFPSLSPETIRWFAPEQFIIAQNTILKESIDQFALALIVAECQLNHSFYHAQSTKELEQEICGGLLSNLSSLSISMQPVLRRAFALSPTARFSSVTEFFDALSDSVMLIPNLASEGNMIASASSEQTVRPEQTERPDFSLEEYEPVEGNVVSDMSENAPKNSVLSETPDLTKDLTNIHVQVIEKNNVEIAPEMNVAKWMTSKTFSSTSTSDSFTEIRRCAQTASAEHLERKLRHEHRFQRFFRIWNFTIFIAIIIMIGLFWTKIEKTTTNWWNRTEKTMSEMP